MKYRQLSFALPKGRSPAYEHDLDRTLVCSFLSRDAIYRVFQSNSCGSRHQYGHARIHTEKEKEREEETGIRFRAV